MVAGRDVMTHNVEARGINVPSLVPLLVVLGFHAMQKVLGVLIAALLVGGAVSIVVMDERLRPETTRARNQEPRIRPAPGQSRITGEVTALDAAIARSTAPLPTPFTISIGAPKGQAVRVTGATVNGTASTLVWDGGRPLPVSGGGGLDLGTLRAVVAGDGITWHLDGEPRRLLPGNYRLGATVAVAGPKGLATPRDQVSFVAGDSTVLTSQGGAVVRTEPLAIHLLGPGSFTMSGKLVVDDGKKVRTLSVGRFAGGAYDVELVPLNGAYRITATVDGMIEG